ncbi:TIFY domain protein 8 isoform 4 [Hibiscus syriacus]|uniref:Protein TIFY n=1 Tax=Hibiscus syriacus TaxID=106335 RepID=A0A6A2YTS7_HIBSY|nr:protein TIFY 8-like isoform X2 [Hibiscus syriacus]KAE8682730.1 TIFY domain protein 8 isoform 4 [Hibiscus syriacus]
MAVLNMAQQSKTTNTNNANTPIHLQHQQEVKPTMFHDFLGTKASNSSFVLAPKASDARFPDASPSPSASVGASTGGGGGAGRGPISCTSDLGSERQVGNHLEGIPYYGPRSEISGPDISNSLAGSKRSSLDSAFLAHESLESLHLMKMLRNGAGEERPRRSNEDEVFLGMKSMRHSSTSRILQPPTGSRLEANATKWELSVPSAVQYGSRGGHFAPFVHQVSSNRFKDTNVGPSVISQAAADEGSRTGIKGPGILTSINASSVPTEKGSFGIVPSGERPKSGAHISETESLVPPSQLGLTTASRQMTIFYAGQAHVFDDVHPNKADVIMALAGSNGGSWSTTYSPKSAVKTVGENYVPNGEPEAVGSIAFTRELRGKTALAGNVSQATGSSDRIPIQTGVPQSTVMSMDGRNLVQAAEPGTEDKREV